MVLSAHAGADAPATPLAELMGGLVLASDLANGFPPEKTLRTVVLAVSVGRHAGCDDATLRDTYYLTLLRFLGCTGFAHEETHIYGAGDDLGTRNTMAMADAADPVGTVRMIARRIGEGGRAVDRVRAVARILFDGEAVQRHARAQCDTSLHLARMVGMSEPVLASLAQVCERFDGKGAPAGLAGEALSMPSRLLALADVAEIAHHRDGEAASLAEVKKRAGKHLDPVLVRVFVAHAGELFAAIGGAGPRGSSVWARFLALEPTPGLAADPSRVDDVALAFAHFGDLKSVHTLGHAVSVADVAARAAALVAMPAEELRDLRHAALLHDLGRVAVPNGIWDKPGALSVGEWERVRLHAYYTERIVLRAPSWSRAAAIASGAHERLDGSGYHRGVPGSLVGRASRLLAAADVWCALLAPRPHRPAMTEAQARDVLAAEARDGLLCRDAVDAVLGAVSGARPAQRAAWPRGLTDREVAVLRLVARGKSNQEIGTLLGISPRTVKNHVAHAYDKIGVYSRAGAALFVTENALLDERR